MSSISETDSARLRRAVDLAREAKAAGDEPFGTVLIGADGAVLVEERNRVGGGDETRHPELAVAVWAARNLTPGERATTTAYTSGEHCPMCAAAHGWVGLGPIVYALSSQQLSTWRRGWGLPESAVAPLPIGTVAPRVEVRGPFPEFEAELRALHAPAGVDA